MGLAAGPAFSEGASKRRLAESKQDEVMMQIEQDEAAMAIFGTYLMTAMADPKAPVEMKVMGISSWGYQALMMTIFLYWVDPLSLRKDAGLDESYHMFAPVRKRVDRISQFATDLWNTPAPSVYDFW